MDWSWWFASIFYLNRPQYGLVVVVYNTEQPALRTSNLVSLFVRKYGSKFSAINIRGRCFSI